MPGCIRRSRPSAATAFPAKSTNGCGCEYHMGEDPKSRYDEPSAPDTAGMHLNGRHNEADTTDIR